MRCTAVTVLWHWPFGNLKHIWNTKHLRSLDEVGDTNYVSEIIYVVPWAILAWRHACAVAAALNARWSSASSWQLLPCPRGLCSPQQAAGIPSGFSCVRFPAGEAQQQSRWILIGAAMWGPDLGRFLWHLPRSSTQSPSTAALAPF